MKTEWKATSKESEKGSVIFESCDIEDYNKASEEYNKLSKSQKAQYKGKRLNFRHGYKNPRPHFCNRSTLIIHI